MNELRLPNGTHIGNTHLRVSSIERSVSFYSDLLGFREMDKLGHSAKLSASGDPPAQVILTELEGAPPKPRATAGLFHVAIRVPSSYELARVLRRLLEYDWPIQGLSDHGVSEALYIPDPDGNGIEIYCDRPPDDWPRKGDGIVMGTQQLDPNDLLVEVLDDTTTWTGIDPATRIGHVHLQASDLAKSEEFYRGVLGLDVTQRDYPGALFLAAGGYHHHVGLNTWAGVGVPPSPPDAAGLISFALVVPDEPSWLAIRTRIEQAGLQTRKPSYSDYTMSLIVKDPDEIAVEVAALV